jgi:hypothetical protein
MRNNLHTLNHLLICVRYTIRAFLLMVLIGYSVTPSRSGTLTAPSGPRNAAEMGSGFSQAWYTRYGFTCTEPCTQGTCYFERIVPAM